MKRLIKALKRFETSNSIDIGDLSLAAQQSMTDDILFLYRHRLVVISTALEHDYPVDAMLTDEGYRKRTQLLGITIPWPS